VTAAAVAALLLAACSTSAGTETVEAPLPGQVGPSDTAAVPPGEAADLPTPSTVISLDPPTTAAPETLPPAAPAANPGDAMPQLPPSGPEPELVAPIAVPITAAEPGASGDNIRTMQQRLLDLGFWVPDTDGQYGFVTKQAVMAFQKHYGIAATGVADQPTVDLMNFVTHRVRGQAWRGDVIEVDKSKQLIYIVRGGRTLWAINASTGSEIPYEEQSKTEPDKIERGDSVTPEGFWKVTRYADPEKGDWVEGELGQIYRPAYFKGGVAVHGSTNIPNYAASHGCVRVSTAAMDFIWSQDLMPLKALVWVHGDIPPRQG
jgi:peptidoglycan hydrolase-like protein with peptidoglycan-binding domain